MIILEDNKQVLLVDGLAYFACCLIAFTLSLLKIQTNTYTEYWFCIIFWLIIFFVLTFSLLLKKKVTFDQENVTLEKYIFSYRITGVQGKVKAIKEWYLIDINNQKDRDIELHIIFNNGGKIVIEDSRFNDFHELRRHLSFDEFYKGKMTPHRK